MDLSKTFDTLNHELLIAKLHAYEFDEFSLKFFRCFLLNNGIGRKSTVNSVPGLNF